MSIEKITPQIAALYLEQKCTEISRGITFKIESVNIWRVSDGDRYAAKYGDFILHLRSLSTLTEQECQMLYHIETGETWFDHYGGEENAPSCIRFWFQDEYKGPTGSPMVWLKMLEIGFDLFGLIPAGLAKEIVDGK